MIWFLIDWPDNSNLVNKYSNTPWQYFKLQSSTIEKKSPYLCLCTWPLHEYNNALRGVLLLKIKDPVDETPLYLIMKCSLPPKHIVWFLCISTQCHVIITYINCLPLCSSNILIRWQHSSKILSSATLLPIPKSLSVERAKRLISFQDSPFANRIPVKQGVQIRSYQYWFYVQPPLLQNYNILFFLVFNVLQFLDSRTCTYLVILENINQMWLRACYVYVVIL